MLDVLDSNFKSGIINQFSELDHKYGIKETRKYISLGREYLKK